MNGFDFPIFGTKINGVTQSFNLSDPTERKGYFSAKVGTEIGVINAYLDSGKTFIAHLLGIKNSGKGTYTKLLVEALGGRNILHLSIGDLVRDVHEKIESNGDDKQGLFGFLKSNYRGPFTVDELENIIHGRDTSKLIPSDFILCLIKYEISKHPKTTIFFDGFPRAKDQISFSLYLKELIGYRDDPDVFVFIDVPEPVIAERIKTRAICPLCHVSKNTRLNPSTFVGFDEGTKEFYLMCDNPGCHKQRLVSKEGDELGIEPIRQRIDVDKDVMRALIATQGIEKMFLRNYLPLATKSETIDAYEITPSYSYKLNRESGEIETFENEWVFQDDDGIDSISLLPAAVVVSLIRQLADFLKKSAA